MPAHGWQPRISEPRGQLAPPASQALSSSRCSLPGKPQPATGLSYMQQRYMDPQLGTFLSVDPLTAYEQPVEQLNRYRYANGNPYKFTDPDGRNATMVAPLVLVPIVIGITYYTTTTPAQRAKAGKAIDRGVQRLFQNADVGDPGGGALMEGNQRCQRCLTAWLETKVARSPDLTRPVQETQVGI
ncbi:MAG: RHS repeat-associated core domain-containing protein [Pseudomonadales bacterium]